VSLAPSLRDYLIVLFERGLLDYFRDAILDDGNVSVGHREVVEDLSLWFTFWRVNHSFGMSYGGRLDEKISNSNSFVTPPASGEKSRGGSTWVTEYPS